MTVSVDHDDNGILEVPRFNGDANGDCTDTEVIALDLNCGAISADSKASRRSLSMEEQLTALQRVLSPSVKTNVFSSRSMTSMSIRLPTATHSLRSQRRVRSGSLSTVNGLIVFPNHSQNRPFVIRKNSFF